MKKVFALILFAAALGFAAFSGFAIYYMWINAHYSLLMSIVFFWFLILLGVLLYPIE